MSKAFKRRSLVERLTLDGLTIAPAQVFGGIRLVPLIAEAHREDLRLSRRVYGDGAGQVALPDDLTYSAYIPHGLVATWGDDIGGVFGTRAMSPADRRCSEPPRWRSGHEATPLRRMARREKGNRLRFLPLHVALEGFLSLHFGGPDIAWSEYARGTLRDGLGHRTERSFGGRAIVGLEDALRVFERHDGQVGLLLFVADSLASAFVTPHPDDYAALRRTLVTDFYGELVYRYGLIATDNDLTVPPIDQGSVNSLDDLRAEVARVRADWAALHTRWTASLFDVPVRANGVYDFSPFSLQRFATGFDPKEVNHIGELIVDDRGRLQYLKTYRLSAAQCRRAYLLSRLAEADWNLADCAALLDCRHEELVSRLQNAGFGYLLHQHVLDAAVAWNRRR